MGLPLHMKINKDHVKRILLISLSNIGDVILTTPVLDVLAREFPEARVDAMVGPLGREIFMSNRNVFKVIVYNKRAPVIEKRLLIKKLKAINYDMIIDLRNSFFPYLIGARYRTSPIRRVSKRMLIHKRDAHLWKLKTLGISTENASFSVHINQDDRDYIDELIREITHQDIIAVNPGAKSFIKRWDKDGFTDLCDRLTGELKTTVIIIGDKNDTPLAEEIASRARNKILNLAGRTSILQLAHLLARCKLLITSDSAPLHLGTAVKTRVLAIFGPTDPRLYGPQESKSRVIRKTLGCSPCGAAQCKLRHECMKLITPDEVFAAAKEMLHE